MYMRVIRCSPILIMICLITGCGSTSPSGHGGCIHTEIGPIELKGILEYSSKGKMNYHIETSVPLENNDIRRDLEGEVVKVKGILIREVNIYTSEEIARLKELSKTSQVAMPATCACSITNYFIRLYNIDKLAPPP